VSPDDVLGYWFSGDDATRNARWWKKNPETDQQIADLFADAVPRAAAGAFDGWAATPRGTLALVILLDQVPRTIHRGDPRSWAFDAKAREIVHAALAQGVDEELPAGPERMFLYMPLMHSERLDDQHRCCDLFRAYGEETGNTGNHDYAVQHRDIVSRFGRFPHRNDILGRPSTEEEIAFLAEPGSSF